MTTTPKSQSLTPRVGMLATVRNRRGLISGVEPYDGGLEGRLHLVHLEYIDTNGPPDDTLIWEREQEARLLEPVSLPDLTTTDPMPAPDFDSLQRATRWTAISPFITPTDLPSLAAPLFGAMQIEDFQLLPLLKALQMPRISLLLADDVGLGKTIEAGLILSELLLRRRIQRVMILCPAALRKQWQQEMKQKFALHFDIIDRAETHALQKRLGLDANPWRTYPRIITSYYYLRQPDVLEQFRAACQQPTHSVRLPWDMLIVDEAHNLMPNSFGSDSDLAKMLRFISPWFEHKLFLSATPHNGYTRSFSGLLEQLDPVRFTQVSDFDPKTRHRIEEVVIRRLKSEINQQDHQQGRLPRFPERIPEPLPLYFGPAEKNLSQHFQTFRLNIRRLTAKTTRSEQLAAIFALSVLNKRLLSSPYTFAHSWYRFKDGLAQDETDKTHTAEVHAARRAVEEDLDDDLEVESRLQHAAKITGAWLKPFVTHLNSEINALDTALTTLGLTAPAPNPDPTQPLTLPLPTADARWERFLQLIKRRLRNGPQWLFDERLIVFTEYKTTLDYLERRLNQSFPPPTTPPGTIKVLYGGLSDDHREAIKQAFNDPADPVRILIATDAAAEGLNLQQTARLILHYDIPFNPARLDQRNGRLDRHGQARDVITHHFSSEDDADLKFLAHVMQKVHTIREDLGSMGEVFDAAFEQRFDNLAETNQVIKQLDQAVAERHHHADIPRSATLHTGQETALLNWLKAELDLSPTTLATTLEHALGFGLGLPRFTEPDTHGRFQLKMPLPPQWESLIDDHLRLPLATQTRSTKRTRRGPLPSLVFDPAYFIQTQNGRPVYRTAKDTVLLHLGHPLLQHALALFARARFPAGLNHTPISRWTVRYGSLPPNAQALVLLTVEELAVNNLREPFHHWVRTFQLPIYNRELGPPLPHLAPSQCQPPLTLRPNATAITQAKNLWAEIDLEIKQFIKQQAATLNQQLQQHLKNSRQQALTQEKARFKNRLQEVKQAMKQTTLQKLEDEHKKIEQEKIHIRQTPALIPEIEEFYQKHLRNISRRQSDIEDELKRRRTHYQALQTQLQLEQDRVLTHLLPKRYTLRGQVQLFPVTIEIRLPIPINK